MNDLEICKRIAEIENVPHHMSQCNKHVMSELNCMDNVVIRYTEYNPLTDDAMCFGFIINDKIELEFDSDLNFVCAIGDVWVNDENLNRAICLVKIKAHKES